MQSTFIDNWVAGAEGGLGSSHAIESAGLLHATVRWDLGMRAPLVQGMPYVTLDFNDAAGLTPQFTTIHAIITVNGQVRNIFFKKKWETSCYTLLKKIQSPDDFDELTDTRFAVELNNGQTWIFYTTEETTFIVGSNTDGGLGTLTASGPATGYIRFGGGKPLFCQMECFNFKNTVAGWPRSFQDPTNLF